MENKKPIIGVTMGDPAGVGAEVIIKALEIEKFTSSTSVVIGSHEVMKDMLKRLDAKSSLNKVGNVEEITSSNTQYDTINLIDLNNITMKDFTYGEVGKESGRASMEYIFKAIELAMEGKIDAIVTSPINKESINIAGFNYAGHTEILADKSNTKDYAMMLMGEKLRVIHVSTHVSLREACDGVKRERVYKVIRLAHNAMQELGIKSPRIGVAGLNPHAGENGLFGKEEIEEIIPAIKKAKSDKINVEGPIPPDTVFAKGIGGQYDIVVAMYHDQGHIPLKTVEFNYDNEKKKWLSVSGVNITLGLPIIRTSVDHGVAFDIAGEGKASPDSMIEAIKAAEKFIV